MKKHFILFLFFCVCLDFTTSAQTINWAAFMQKQALQWDSIGNNYYSGAFIGNGLLGMNIYKPAQNEVHFDIGRSDVVDNRTAQYPNLGKLYTQARLPIGYYVVKTSGNILSSKVTLDIYNAKALGTLVTDLGEIRFTAYVAAEKEVMVLTLSVSGKEKRPELSFVADKSISPRYLQSYPKDKPSDFPANPAIQKTVEGNLVSYHQPLLNGGGYTTVCKNILSGSKSTTLTSIGYDEHNQLDETAAAKQNIVPFEQNTLATNEVLHQKWWHEYYQKSFVSLPDKRMESFYWSQLYKLASATRGDKPMLDLMGPWTSPTPWPAIWWNLNTQLTYSPVFTINHVDLSQSLFDALNKNINNLIKNVPSQWQKNSAAIGRSSSYNLVSKISNAEIQSGDFEPANLTWTMFYYYQYYLYTGDEVALKNKIYPLLKRSTNFLIHLLEKDNNGVYHLRLSHSPEYKNAADANYSLSSLRWALETLINVNAKLKLKDVDEEVWKDVLIHLVDFPKNETGFMIGKDVSLESSHRHYSHLLMIYPYHLINWEREADREVIEKSLNHWISLKGALQGYTFTGAASIYASMGRGDSAYDMLNQLFDKYIRPNTLYRESGPVIETPLSAVTSINEMLLQSWGGKIRVFHAIPSKWKNVEFNRLLAEGGFEVSAKLKDGKTSYIQIKSRLGGDCSILTDLTPALVKNCQ